MAPQKSKKARGKARARRTPSPTPPPTPPRTARRGRRAGATTYTTSDLRLLLRVVQRRQPRTGSDWSGVEADYNAQVSDTRQRRAENLRTRFDKLVRMKKPTGDPQANELHELAVEIYQELEGLEHTRVLDDSPPASRDTLELTSDSEPEILDSPAPVPPSNQQAWAARHSAPSAEFRATACKVRTQTRSTQPHNPLDAATAQLASVLDPSAEREQHNRQREDDIGRLTIFSLNETIRDLRAELTQERQRSATLERQLRDEEMRRLVEQQVQRQLHQRLPDHPGYSGSPFSNSMQQHHAVLNPLEARPGDQYHPSPRTSTAPTTNEAHPSWMPGPPPERSDASGSGSKDL
ncbi:hypothetical protein FRC07_009203 [Ceratobasidium sp. 392]|nr:hypothetical protein FRC07_009203 [Ceratobasidium sp. 392]